MRKRPTARRMELARAVRCSAEIDHVPRSTGPATAGPFFLPRACRGRDSPAIMRAMTERAAFPVQVRLFARYAELLGASLVTVRLKAGGTVADVVHGVRALPGGGALPERMLVARGVDQVRYDQAVSADDELAFLPPMAGG